MPREDSGSLSMQPVGCTPLCSTDAVPSSSAGTLLNYDAVRLGLPVCQPHQCRCCTQIDNLGLHPLTSSRSVSHCPCLRAFNGIVKRAFDTAVFQSILEPAGLSLEDGTRSNGVTRFPLSGGKCLVWDATCVDIFTSNNLIRSALHPGQAAADAERRKRSEYLGISNTYEFQDIWCLQAGHSVF